MVIVIPISHPAIPKRHPFIGITFPLISHCFIYYFLLISHWYPIDIPWNHTKSYWFLWNFPLFFEHIPLWYNLISRMTNLRASARSQLIGQWRPGATDEDLVVVLKIKRHPFWASDSSHPPVILHKKTDHHDSEWSLAILNPMECGKDPTFQTPLFDSKGVFT